MAAYAALVSLMHIIDDLHRHPCPPISLPKEEVASLTVKVTFLQEFLESYNPSLDYSTEADPLEIRIADAAYAAEDAIETQIVDTITKETNSGTGALYRALKKVIQEMASIEKVVMEIKKTGEVKYQQQRKSTPPPSSSSAPQKKIMMVGADDVLLEMKSKLTSDARALQIVPIVGMGGSGKTTLALKIYQDGLIEDHFDVRAWATVSQEYIIQQILIQLLTQLKEKPNQALREGELGEVLYKHLYLKRYLIIIDDMWNIDAWDRIRNFFPNINNGSRIVVTTRLLNLSCKLSTSNGLEMNLLDGDHSWDLLSKTVFGEKGCCPPELESIGKKIGKSCKGLPLSIVAVGGILAKSEQTREFWEYIEGNLSSIVNLGDDERCLKILYMSYKQLPVYLKPCFLYMGVFHEDEEICISELIRIWVAEGFLKAASGKSLEEVARACLESLIDRNLVLIDKKGRMGNIKSCKMHDLLRDMCLREAEKERFYAVLTTPPTRQGLPNAAQHRIVISNAISRNEVANVVSSTPRARSLIWHRNDRKLPYGLSSRLLRVLLTYKTPGGFFKDGYQMVNARLLSLTNMTPVVSLTWNLQTLNVFGEFTLRTDIWYMPHIRHVRCPSGIHLPDPPNGRDDFVLGNLQTMGYVWDFKFNEQSFKKIPNIKKLQMVFDKVRVDGDGCCLKDLDCLDKLEFLNCTIYQQDFLPHLISFPNSLKKLILYTKSPCAEEILEKIGVLPHLQKLVFFGAAFREREWITTKGRFPSLKFLQLGVCKGLKVWTTESSHFPCLENLRLDSIDENIKIPLEFAEIATLRLIELAYCSGSVLSSAKSILEEQEELYGEEETSLQVQVLHYKKEKEHDSLASPNFRFTYNIRE